MATDGEAVERKALALLIDVAAAVYQAMDNSETRHDGEEAETVLFEPWAKELAEAINALDELPDDQPGYTMDPPAKAAWALRHLAAAPAPDPVGEIVAWLRSDEPIDVDPFARDRLADAIERGEYRKPKEGDDA